MIECVRIYLEKGLLKMPTKNLEYRKLIDDISIEVHDYFQRLEFNKGYLSKEIYDGFIMAYPDKQRYMTQKRLTQGLKKFADHYKYQLINSRQAGLSSYRLVDEAPF